MSAKSRSTLASELATAVNDNTAGDVTPAEVRGVITDANDSAINKTDEATVLSLSLLSQSTATGLQSVVECPPASRTISAGTGLSGGGDLSANRSFAVSYGSSAGTSCQGNDSRLSDSRAPTGSAGGDLTDTYPNPTIGNDAVTNAKLANMAASLIKARKTASTGDPEDCTLSEVLDLIGSAAQGDILYRGASGWARLAAGTLGDVLATQGAGANPQWATPSSGGAADVQIFTSSGTWTKPSGKTTTYVLLIAGGAGGGSGRRGAAGTIRSGGGGGGGGSVTELYLPTSALGATETVTVGTGGAGGAARTTDDTNGASGSGGGASSFGAWAYAGGGNAGGAGDADGASGGTGGTGRYAGSAGGASSATGGAGSAGTGATSGFGGAGGGGGGGITSGDIVSSGAAGGEGPRWWRGSTQLPGGTGGVSSTNGGAGSAAGDDTWIGGSGGGGGGASSSPSAGSGGAGAKFGGGGGGGGAAGNGSNSGAGGNGADGIAVVISY